MKKTNSTTVICSNCGAEIAIAEHEHTVKNATVIGKDSGLGTVALPLAKKGKAGERLEALKKAGIDTSNLYAMQGASGEGMIVRIQNGIPTFVEDDDPIFKSIKDFGTIPERRLFRRWVMAQMFALLSKKDYITQKPVTFNKALARKGYKYQWTMLEEELRVQATLYIKDMECFKERNRWFNKDVVLKMCEEYVQTLRKYVDGLAVHKCKGVPYKKIGGKNIFVSDIDAKVFSPILGGITCIRYNKHFNNPLGLWSLVRDFNKKRIAIPWCTPQEKSWIDAYKGAGAYFTMKNLIMFHGCKYKTEGEYGVFYDYEDSMKKLEVRAEAYKTEGWRMFAMMKKLIADNGIDIAKKRAEWKKKRNGR